MELTRKKYIVRCLCDKRQTIIRMTKRYYISYKMYDSIDGNFVVVSKTDESGNLIKTEKVSVMTAINQLVRNFNQI